MTHRILTIIESPLAGTGLARPITRRQAVEYGRLALRHSIEHLEIPYASHLLYAQPDVLDDTDSGQRAHGITMGHDVMRHYAKLVAVYADFGISAGMKQGIAVAQESGIPVEVRYIL